MLSWALSFFRKEKLNGLEKKVLSFEEKLAWAHELLGKQIILGGKPYDVVKLNETTAEIGVQVGDELKWYDPAWVVRA